MLGPRARGAGLAPLLLVALALLGGPASAQDPAPGPPPGEVAPVGSAVAAFLREWAEATRDVRTLRVSFTQTKTLRILKRPLVRRGETLLKDRRVLMVTLGADGRPETELLVTESEARLHHPRLKRLEVFPISPGAAPPTPFPLFGSDLEDLPSRYRLALEEGPQPGLRTLILVPRQPDSPVAETRMTFRGADVVAVAQRNRRGDRVEIQIERFERNPVIERELVLDVPPGTSVTRLGE